MRNVFRGTGALLLAALVGCRTDDPGNAALQAQIDEMQLQIDDLQAQIDAGAAKNAEQDTRLDGHDVAIEEIAGTDVGAVLTQVQDHEDAIAALETLTDSQGDDLAAVQNDVADLETSLVAVQGDVSSIETNITVLSTRLDGTETDISGLQTSVTSLGTRVAAAETTVAAHTAAIASNASAITALDVDVATLSTDLTSVKATNTAQDTSIATHTSDIAAIKSVDTAQDTTIASHTSDIAALKSADTAQDTTIASHTSTLSSYGSRLGTLEGDMTAVEGDASDALLENTMWRTTFSTEHGDDVVNPVPNRTLTMTKVSATSALRITYFDAFRAIGNAGACRWEVLIDGNPCAAPGSLEHDHHTTGNVNLHFNSTIEGVCTATSSGAIGAGSHVISVRVSNMPGYGGDCYTGWNQGRFTGLIEVNEEL